VTRARAITVGAAMALAGGLVGLLLLVVVPLPFGGRPVTVLSDSMEPALRRGDLIVAMSIRPAEARPGDVITFTDPSRPGRLLTHRLVRTERHGPVQAMVTQGDANAVPERWSVPFGGRIGRVAYRVPFVGRLVLALPGGPARRVIFAAPLLLLALLELRATFRRPHPPAVAAPEGALR